MNLSSLKGVVRNRLLEHGVEVRKAPTFRYQALPIFDLCVQYLMLKRGAQLRFVQVGANDGVFGDPLRHYVLNYAWTGVLVEPQPAVFQLLKKNYASQANLNFENVAISSLAGSISLYLPPAEAVEPTYAQSVASAKAAITARQLGLKARELVEISVPCMTLNALCEKYNMTEFDVLQIDTEGYELEVIKSLDFKRCDVALIQFEHGHLNRQQCDSMARHLESSGYDLYWGGHQSDSIALKQGLLENSLKDIT